MKHKEQAGETRTAAPIRRDGVQKRSIDMARSRVMIAGLMFVFCFSALAVRLVQLGVEGRGPGAQATDAPVVHAPRGEITDRNGVMLATNLDVASLYADPRVIPDPKDAARRLVGVLPDLDEKQVLKDLTSGRSFIWIRRKLSPRQQWQVNALGIPGLSFREESNRIYPQGRMLSHAVGFVDVDNHGLEGVEKEFDSGLSDPVAPETVVTSVDVRVQHALYNELSLQMAKFSAKGAAGVVMDVNTGEVLAMVSLPDFDPQHPGDAPDKARFNYVTEGVYEMGSPFKAFTIAAALQNSTISLGSTYDTTKPIHIARFTINDFHGEKLPDRPLSVPEIFLYSSNIGAAKIGVELGGAAQQAFFRKVGLMQRSEIELPEVGAPLYPTSWGEITTMTASFGHGIAVSPMQLVTGISALVNGGLMRPATVLSAANRRLPAAQRVISPEVSRMMCDLMRLVVTEGTGKNASAAGYDVGGKTGTAEKSENGGYAHKSLLSSFVGIFPTSAPKYVVFAMLDEPKGLKSTFGFATGGWTAAPLVGKVISRIGPILGVYPEQPDQEAPKFDAPALLASYGIGQ